MTARNGIRTENKMKRLAAAIGVALVAMLAAASLSPARADAAGTSDGNLVIDVPTTVPCALMADGTVVSPSDWKITTSGDAYISSASASGFPANVEWSARTTDLAATQAGAVQVAGTGDAATVSGPSDPAGAALAPSAGFEWSFSKLDANKNSNIIGKAASGTAVLGSVTFTFSKVQTAFAVYSADDQSLTFYKRANVPAAGQMFEGKTATEVYEGVEKASYTMADGAPWAGHAAELASVKVADAGISPVSTAYWFNGASKLGSVDIAALDTSQTTCMDGMFQGCSSLGSLDLSTMSTRRVASMTAFLGGCDSLAELSIGSEFAWVGDDCYPPTGNWKQGSTGTNYAESQIPANKTDKYTRVKTAFAVYSADDQSLTFYKRFEVPAKGSQFLGKTVTGVYTGFETKVYFSARSVPWSAYKSDVKTVSVADEGIAPRSTEMWFSDMAALGSVDMLKLDTSNVVRMGFMFDGCGSLTSLDLSSFDTHNVMRMDGMFNGCKALTTLDLSSFDTGKVTDMDGMFSDCKALTSLNLSSFDTGNVVNMDGMFNGCGSLTSLDLSSFDTGKVTDMSSMFMGCKALTTIDLSTFNTGNVTRMNDFFWGCAALTTLDLSSFDTRGVTDMSDMFDGCTALTVLNLSSFDTGNVTEMNFFLESCDSLERITLGAGFKWVGQNCFPHAGNWESVSTGKAYSEKEIPTGTADTYVFKPELKSYAVYSKDDQSLTFYKRFEVPANGTQFLGKTVTKVFTGFETKTYEYVDNVPWSTYRSKIKTVTVADEGIAPVSTKNWFMNMWALESADISKLDTANVTSMDHMFDNCESLASLDLSSFDTGNVTDMNSMFRGCKALASLDLSSFSTSNVTDMTEMFAACSTLTALDVSSLDTRNVTDMTCMFYSCRSLASLDLSSFDTSNVTSMDRIFSRCAALTSLNVSSFVTGKVTDMYGMFSGCKALTALDLSSFDTGSITNTSSMSGMFSDCSTLQKVTFGADWKWVGTNGYLPTPSSAYIAGADGKWYDTEGNGCAPADIPSNKAMTYTAIPPIPTKTAFAVYSADDNSLAFYKRTGMPSGGEQFEGKTATEIYEGVEKASYTAADGAPWAGHAAELASVKVADAGISPTSTAYWFKGASKLRSVDIAGLDTSQTTCMDGMFNGCSSLESLDLSTMSTRRVASMTAFLGGCDSLAELSLGSEFAWVDDDCYPPAGNWNQESTGTNYSESDIPANKTDKYTRTKTAFAVYSADDQSLTFYKRPVVPAKGSQFLGKTASKVFTGFETGTYSPSSVPWAAYWSNVKTVTVADAGISPTSTAYWFKGASKLGSVDIAGLDTSQTTCMDGMFNGCKALTTLDVSSFDTHNVTSMVSMFDGCGSLTSLDVSHFDTANVTDMYGVFWNCGSLTSLDVSSFETGNVTNMRNMFCNCKALTTLNLSSFDTHNVTSMRCMFMNCSVLTSLDLSSFDTHNVKDMAYAFGGCGSMASLDLSSFDTHNVTSMVSMFDSCKALTSLDVSHFDTANVTRMSNMFLSCESLTSLDLSSFSTSNVTSMGYMFSDCKALTTLDLSSWNTSNVADMSYMFRLCSKLSVDCSNWNVSKVTNHSNFNKNAPGVTVPLAWRTSSDEGVDDPAIAPLCDEQGNGNALSIPNESDKLEAGNGAKTSTEVADATQKAVEGVPTPEEKVSEKSNVSTEHEGTGETGISKLEVVSEATKENASAIVTEGSEKTGAVKSGE